MEILTSLALFSAVLAATGAVYVALHYGMANALRAVGIAALRAASTIEARKDLRSAALRAELQEVTNG